MRKSRPKGRLNQRIPACVPASIDVAVKLKSTIRRGLFDPCVQTGVQAMQEFFQHELNRLVKPRYRHDEGRKAQRGGTTPTTVVLGGRKAHVRRPRGRTLDGKELRLKSLEMFASEDPLCEQVMGEVLAGASMRRYGSTLDKAPDDLEAFGTTRSAVSRHFVACTKQKLKTFLSRPLGDLKLVDIMFDGVEAAGRRSRLSSERTSPSSGAQSTRCATSSTICRTSAARSSAPLSPRPSAATPPPRAASSSRPSPRSSRRNSPAPPRPSSKASTISTVLDPGIRGRLRRFLQTTNAIENLFSRFRHLSRNVKRWRSGSMVLHWVGAAAINAAKRFRRVKGHGDLRQLADALKPRTGKEAKRA